MGTKERFTTAARIAVLRESGSTWPQVRDAVGLAESTGRKMLGELAEHPKAEQLLAEARRELEAPKPKPKEKATPKQPAGARSGRYLKGVCACAKPKVIRVSKTVLESGVVCTECGELFFDADAEVVA